MKKASLVLIGCLAAWSPGLAESIWVEGESPLEADVQKHGWYGSVKKEELSGGGVLGHWGKKEGRAVYQIEVKEAGEYALWLRANPVKAKLKVRVIDGSWMLPDFKKGSHEQINIAADNKPDLRFVAWVKAGVVNLAKGERKVEVRFVSENHHHGMLDCFCLTKDMDWKPQGTLKPGEEASHWAVPELTTGNLGEWVDFIRPSKEELGWRAVRWHRSLSDAADEAKKLGRPILLWAMNGHPCGET